MMITSTLPEFVIAGRIQRRLTKNGDAKLVKRPDGTWSIVSPTEGALSHRHQLEHLALSYKCIRTWERVAE